MFKKVIHILIAASLLVYLTFSVAFISPKVDKAKECNDIQIKIMETGAASYLSADQIETMLEKAHVQVKGQKMSDIYAASIEKTLKENKLIKNAEVYKTINGKLIIRVYQRVPVLRVISGQGGYYVDTERQIMPVPLNYAAYVPVATGAITNEYATTQLYDFADFLSKNNLWNDKIEQIHILPNLDVELTPRKGNHTIVLGKIENYKENLEKLLLFYEKGLDRVGWNKYSRINLKYKNQVICTKRE
jgi:cell division protein FtsQ